MKKILLLAVVSAFSYVSYGQALYRHIVQSEGNYELEGKKFFIQDSHLPEPKRFMYDLVKYTSGDVSI